ncbi:S-adenosylmethionine-dependent methyltransferase [Orbilia oligospora]|uniref:S-adenosylmethionine-dependent methyltransferase n=1 Tax=Orbilia oligospora TaxID=2813651 RepID=A0A7C8R8R2_ORBOL|nr:S-adenosylmethionine-dependent methyltransferase [Orbilia oligospora]
MTSTPALPPGTPLKLPTPSTSHITSQPVYPPSEDSYLLLDAFSLPSEIAFISSRLPAGTPSPLLVEIGTGSGIVSAFLAAHAGVLFGRQDVITMGLDVSYTANTVTSTTISNTCSEHPETSATFLDCMTSDLTSCLKPNCVDILVFNPPYVPTSEHPSLSTLRDGKQQKVIVNSKSREDYDMEDYLFSLTYAGGDKGMETTDRLLDQLHEVLSERGVLYLLLCAGNRPPEVLGRVTAMESGWKMERVIERRAGEVQGVAIIVIRPDKKGNFLGI